MTMGDRVAVMRKGVLQQVGAPQELYEQPSNLFVAEFIGSPAMNLVEAEVARRDGGLALRFGEHTLHLESSAAEDALASYVGRRVLMGLRPEDLEDAALSGSASPENTLTALTDIREDMGPEVYVHFSLGVPPVRRPEVEEATREDDPTSPSALGTRAVFVARLRRETNAREGESLRLRANTRRLYFFDPETGGAIRAEA